MKKTLANLKKYFYNKIKRDKDNNFIFSGNLEEIMGIEGVSRLGKCWDKYGAELEYLRMILEYQQVISGEYTKEEQILIKETSKEQNIFLKQCLEKVYLNKEYNREVEKADRIE